MLIPATRRRAPASVLAVISIAAIVTVAISTFVAPVARAVESGTTRLQGVVATSTGAPILEGTLSVVLLRPGTNAALDQPAVVVPASAALDVPVPTGTFDVVVVYRGAENLTQSARATLTFRPGEVVRQDVVIAGGAVVTGIVSRDVGRIVDPVLSVDKTSRYPGGDGVGTDPVTGSRFSYVWQGRDVAPEQVRVEKSTGRFRVVGLDPSASYRLTGGEWGDGRDVRWTDAVHELTVGADLGPQTVDLTVLLRSAVSGRIVGTAVDGTAVPVTDGSLSLVPTDGRPGGLIPLQRSDDGRFTFFGAAPGEYSLVVTPERESLYLGPDEVHVVIGREGEQLDVGDVVLDLGGRLSGTLTADEYENQFDATLRVAPVVSGEIQIFRRADDSDSFVAYETLTTGGDGSWSAAGLAPGTYRVGLGDPSWYEPAPHDRLFWPSSRRLTDARDLVITAGRTIDGLDARLGIRSVDVHRLAGPDRYGTGAAAVSSPWGFPDGVTPVPVLYVANGQNFPDALSAGPAAVHEGGALLLVDRDAVPAATRAEISRLAPQRIVVVGGPAAVSDAVFAQLRSLQPAITRVAGADRYETSRKVVARAFGDGADVTYLASGASFPDALSAGPAAAHFDGPVLLVRGDAGGVDRATLDVLGRLGSSVIAVAGGEAAVAPGVEASLLDETTADVVRYAGDDRFETSIALASVFPEGETAFVATGRGFADALVGGAIAALDDSPLYLSERTCVPRGARDDILAAGTLDVVLLGGEFSLSRALDDFDVVCGG